MNTNALTKHYGTLTTGERLRLFIEAAARRDVEELDNLNNTCPQKTYRVEDWDYLRGKSHAHIAALMHHGSLAKNAYVTTRALLALIAFEDKDDKEAEIEMAERVFRKAAGQLIAKTQAWNDLAEKVGIAPDKIAAAFGVDELPGIEIVLAVADEMAVEAEQTEREQWAKGLWSIWSVSESIA